MERDPEASQTLPAVTGCLRERALTPMNDTHLTEIHCLFLRMCVCVYLTLYAAFLLWNQSHRERWGRMEPIQPNHLIRLPQRPSPPAASPSPCVSGAQPLLLFSILYHFLFLFQSVNLFLLLLPLSFLLFLSAVKLDLERQWFLGELIFFNLEYLSNKEVQF